MLVKVYEDRNCQYQNCFWLVSARNAVYIQLCVGVSLLHLLFHLSQVDLKLMSTTTKEPKLLDVGFSNIILFKLYNYNYGPATYTYTYN